MKRLNKEENSNLRSKFEELSEDELEFINLFLKNEGNVLKMIGALPSKTTRGEIKNKLSKINKKLGNEDEHPGLINYKDIEDMIKNIKVYPGHIQHRDVSDRGGNECDLPPSVVIIDKFNENQGIAKILSLRGKENVAWMTQDGVVFESFPSLVCKWKAFDEIVEKARELGGRMYRGDAAVQKGAKIGIDLSTDTIDGFISLSFYEGQIGKATIRRSTYFAAVLDWAGIAKNCPAEDEKGGYIELNSGWFLRNDYD